MKISSSNMIMQSSRRYTSSWSVTQRFQFNKGLQDAGTKEMNGQEETTEKNGKYENTYGENNKQENIQEPEASQTYDSLKNYFGNLRITHLEVRQDTSSVFEQFRQQTIRSIFAMLFGEEKAKEIFEDREISAKQTEVPAQTLQTGTLQSAGRITYRVEQQYAEQESTYFSTNGIVRTADGREINIRVDVGMSRSFQAAFSKEMTVDTCDPLILNFDGNAAELTDQKFYFDLDCDGKKELISGLGSGSGYLALDKNGDGVIGDGRELFGPGSGNGFEELAAYDEDGNGWIDENDAIFNSLKIWCKDENGNDRLYSLAEKGLGAICLQNISTDFSLKNAKNETNGIIRNTGIFLYENGVAGTIQHVDMARHLDKTQ
ncbi:MAG: hypothetical protein UGE21_04235 [Lachnospiraceae bacterium]|nr:hypothetical protein [Lachnospiraceae bacterium]